MTARTLRAPVQPLRVLLAAVFLPGFGHVLAGFAQRGLIFQMFAILMAWITWHATPPERDLVGRLAGGIFVYAISIMDAYRLAQLRYAAYRRSTSSRTGATGPKQRKLR